MMFNGEFEHKIDAKGRVFVPRRILEEIADPAERNHFHVVVSEEGCLDVHTESGFRRYVREALASQRTAHGARMLKRRMGAYSRRIPLDAQGRLTLPEELRRKIRLGNEAMVVGSINYFEIWDREVYTQKALPEAEAYYEEQAGGFLSSDYLGDAFPDSGEGDGGK